MPAFHSRFRDAAISHDDDAIGRTTSCSKSTQPYKKRSAHAASHDDMYAGDCRKSIISGGGLFGAIFSAPHSAATYTRRHTCRRYCRRRYAAGGQGLRRAQAHAAYSPKSRSRSKPHACAAISGQVRRQARKRDDAAMRAARCQFSPPAKRQNARARCPAGPAQAAHSP